MTEQILNEAELTLNDNTRDRLKSLFKRGACPTEGDFAALIDAFIHRLDDGYEKGTIQGPIRLETGTEDQMLVFSRVHPEDDIDLSEEHEKDWCITIHENEDTHESCLSISQQDNERPILYLHDLGRIGIGTDQPKAKIHVTGNSIVERNLTVGADLNVTGVINVEGMETRKNIALNKLQALVNQEEDQSYDLCDADGTMVHLALNTKKGPFGGVADNTMLTLSGCGVRHEEQSGEVSVDVSLKDETGETYPLGTLWGQDSGGAVVFPVFSFMLDDDNLFDKSLTVQLSPGENTLIEESNLFNLAVIFA